MTIRFPREAQVRLPLASVRLRHRFLASADLILGLNRALLTELGNPLALRLRWHPASRFILLTAESVAAAPDCHALYPKRYAASMCVTGLFRRNGIPIADYGRLAYVVRLGRAIAVGPIGERL